MGEWVNQFERDLRCCALDLVRRAVVSGSEASLTPDSSYQFRTIGNEFHGSSENLTTMGWDDHCLVGTVAEVDSANVAVGGPIANEMMFLVLDGDTTNNGDLRPKAHRINFMADKDGRFAIRLPLTNSQGNSYKFVYIWTMNSLVKKILMPGQTEAGMTAWVNGFGSNLKLKYGDMNGNNVIEPGSSGADKLQYDACEFARVAMITASGEKSIYFYDYGVDLNQNGFINPNDFDILNSWTFESLANRTGDQMP